MKRSGIPIIFERVLRWIISSSIYDEVLGDLTELYELRKESHGTTVARFYLIKDTILSIRNTRLRRRYKTQNPLTMHKNYLKIAYRNILKHKFYTLANTVSLAVGLASVILITLFVQQELSYDKFHTKGDRIYRLNKLVNRDGQVAKNAESSGLFGPGIADQIPEVVSATRVGQRFASTFVYKDNNIRVNDVKFVDANFFETFDFKLIRGTREDVLAAPANVVLTERIATAIFGSVDPIGKTIQSTSGITYAVTGIAENVPKNSHIQFEMVISWETTVEGRGPFTIGWMNNWYTQGMATYLMLEPNSDPESVNQKLPAFEEQNIPERAEMYDFYLQPFEEVYLGSADVQFSPAMTGTKFIYILSSIALAILLIAIFNYVNISTSKAATRAKEIGVRKVVGALRRQIVVQHLVESFLMVFLSAVLAMLLVKTALPFFNEFTGRTLAISDAPTSLIVVIIGVVIMVSLASGIYPALIMSGFKAVQVLKGSLGGKSFGNTPRQVLLTIQFIITIIMIGATILISSQTRYMNNKDLGYNKDNVLTAELSYGITDNLEPFVNELLKDNNITDYTISEQTPRHANASFAVYPEGIREKEVEARLFSVDEHFIGFYEIQFVEGRAFDINITSDVNALVINETMQERLGWDDPIGRQLDMDDNQPIKTVIGVVKDFNFRSLHGTIQPMIMGLTDDPYNLSIKTTPTNTAEVIAALERAWQAFEPNQPLVYSFLEDDLAAFYQSEQNIFKAIMIFAIISVLISCFGLYGLTSYTVQRKFKEIGIRKVLGANESAVVYLINKKFMITLVIALFIAVPVTVFMMSAWLQGFAYKIDLGPIPFAIAVLLTFAITALTISLQTIRAARANPVNALRTE